MSELIRAEIVRERDTSITWVAVIRCNRIIGGRIRCTASPGCYSPMSIPTTARSAPCKHVGPLRWYWLLSRAFTAARLTTGRALTTDQRLPVDAADHMAAVATRSAEHDFSIKCRFYTLAALWPALITVFISASHYSSQWNR